MNKCIIFSAFGDVCLNEAVVSAKAAKKNMAENITLVLHAEKNFARPDGCEIFDHIFEQKKPKSFQTKPYAFKIQGMINACEEPGFDEFLFLDTDTVIMDVAVAHAPDRTIGEKINSIPDCFPEFNTGVIVFKKTCLAVFEQALHLYLSEFIKHPHDQGAFRKAIYFSKLRIATLPPEYNHRGANLINCFIWHNHEAIKYFKNRDQP